MFIGRFVIATMTVEGLHNWTDANVECPESGFLSHRHRHMFKIEATAYVDHADRAIEFIQLRRNILTYIHTSYRRCEKYKMIDFGSMSCEMIAADIIEQFPELTKVVVWEDGENAGGVEKIQC